MIKIVYMFLALLLPIFVATGTVVSINGKFRIVGGKDANITDYPYQVSVLSKGKHICGGSILSEKIILTAAHCTYDIKKKDLSIRVGSSQLNAEGYVYNISKLYVHPKFAVETYNYDISLFELSVSLVFGPNVQKISVASSGTVISTGLVAVATGWGMLYDEGPLSKQLQVVEVPTITTKDCKNYYNDNISETMFCAGYEKGGKDTCVGDSGGPLVVSGILIGITSWGGICAAPKNPGVYTDLPLLRKYIDSIVNA